MIDIRDIGCFKENKQAVNYLVENYYNLPTVTEYDYILLTNDQMKVVETIYKYLTEHEQEIKIDTENSFLFSKIEQLYRNIKTKGELKI